jgi:hypothetical protein
MLNTPGSRGRCTMQMDQIRPKISILAAYRVAAYRVNLGLLFDREAKPKPAFRAVAEALGHK